MEMPTVCDCGEIVEFDDMKAVGKELYCAECHQEMTEGEMDER